MSDNIAIATTCACVDNYPEDGIIDVIPLWYEPSIKYNNLESHKDFVIMHYIDPITMIRYCDLVYKGAIPRMESAIKGAYTISYNTAI